MQDALALLKRIAIPPKKQWDLFRLMNKRECSFRGSDSSGKKEQRRLNVNEIGSAWKHSSLVKRKTEQIFSKCHHFHFAFNFQHYFAQTHADIKGNALKAGVIHFCQIPGAGKSSIRLEQMKTLKHESVFCVATHCFPLHEFYWFLLEMMEVIHALYQLWLWNWPSSECCRDWRQSKAFCLVLVPH